MEIRHILAPTDFSELAKQAVDYAYGLAQKFGARLWCTLSRRENSPLCAGRAYSFCRLAPSPTAQPGPG